MVLKDKIMVGAIIGLLADAVKLIFNYLAYLLGFTNVVFWQITATRFLEKEVLHTPAAYLIGGAADVTVSAGLGVAFFLFVHYVGGRDYLWFKGIGFGMFVWVALFSTLLGQSVQAKLPQTASGILVTLGAHFVFGLGLAFFTSLLYNFAGEKEPEKKQHNLHRFIPLPAKKVTDNNDVEHTDEPNKLIMKKPVKLKQLKNIVKIKSNKD